MTRTISRILVPTDFSAASEAALEYAVTLADRFGASLHLLHVVEDPFVGGAFGSELYITSVPAMRAHLVDEAAQRLCRILGQEDRERLKATSEVRVGAPAAAIREAAHVQHCDLVVMGTHGRSGMAHLLLGSVAEKVVRHAPCPVLTVRNEAAAALAAERAFFAHDMVPTE
jgi:nucleotide-binding universal stress UspA family protein